MNIRIHGGHSSLSLPDDNLIIKLKSGRLIRIYESGLIQFYDESYTEPSTGVIIHEYLGELHADDFKNYMRRNNLPGGQESSDSEVLLIDRA